MKIEPNRVVNVEYELFVTTEKNELELMERATAENPLNFIYGVGMMLPKFEANLFGLSANDTFEFVLQKEDAYGEYEDERVVELERSVFEIDGKLDESIVFEGNVVPLMDSEGNRLQGQVAKVTDTHVTIDLNHPLAGETLTFKGKVLDVREATEKDLQVLQGGCGGNCHCDHSHDHDHDHDCCGGGGHHHHKEGGCCGCH